MRVDIDDHGISWEGLFSSRHLAWDDMLGYTFDQFRERARSIFQVVTVYGRGAGMVSVGRSIRFGTDIDVDRIIAKAHAVLRQRSERDFKPFLLTPNAVVHETKGRLLLAEIEQTKLTTSGELIIYKRGKTVGWAATRLVFVNNGLLLVEELAALGVVVTVEPGMLLPTTVHERLQRREYNA